MIEEPQSNTLHEMFFDSAGKAVERDRFYKMYPDGRQRIARSAVFGLAVSSEFVGVNHNPDPNGAPWIYETIVLVDGDIVYSKWTSSIDEAAWAHIDAKNRVRFGGFAWWRARNYLQRARQALRRAL